VRSLLAGLVIATPLFCGLYLAWLVLAGVPPPDFVAFVFGLLATVIAAFLAMSAAGEGEIRSDERELIAHWVEQQRATLPPDRPTLEPQAAEAPGKPDEPTTAPEASPEPVVARDELAEPAGRPWWRFR
jgi:hypothetical protein